MPSLVFLFIESPILRMQTMRCRCSNRLPGIILQEVCTPPVRVINKRAKSTLQTSKRAQSTLQHRKVQPLAESNDVTEFPYRRLQDNDDIGHIGMKRFQRGRFPPALGVRLRYVLNIHVSYKIYTCK